MRARHRDVEAQGSARKQAVEFVPRDAKTNVTI
jgi:hypothetical protein